MKPRLPLLSSLLVDQIACPGDQIADGSTDATDSSGQLSFPRPPGSGPTTYPTGFRAWLSDASDGPQARFAHGPEFYGVPYVLRGGLRVADDYADLVVHGPRVGPFIDEFGLPHPGARAWTNTTALGGKFSSTQHCNGWTSAAAAQFARIGLAQVPPEDLEAWQESAAWTDYLTKECSKAHHLYCFEN